MYKSELKSVLIGLSVTLLVLVGLYFFCDHFQFPLGLTAAFLLFAFAVIFTIMDYKKFKTAQKVGFIGLSISAGLLSILFAYDYFIEDIRITSIHIAAIILPPLMIGNYLLKKEKKYITCGFTNDRSYLAACKPRRGLCPPNCERRER